MKTPFCILRIDLGRPKKASPLGPNSMRLAPYSHASGRLNSANDHWTPNFEAFSAIQIIDKDGNAS